MENKVIPLLRALRNAAAVALVMVQWCCFVGVVVFFPLAVKTQRAEAWVSAVLMFVGVLVAEAALRSLRE